MEPTTSSSGQPALNVVKVGFNPSYHSLVIIKPDAMKSELWGEILGQFAVHFGMLPKLAKLITMTDVDINAHYAEHLEKDFFPGLSSFMKSGPSLVILMYGFWETSRNICMNVRRHHKCTGPANLIHASDSVENVIRETGIWFPGVFK